ncbi:WD40-repeat-containing domain protein [Chytridium lagenaria]|nr:WD40-repeat-containing domain protein [Chytridium lagenaria]
MGVVETSRNAGSTTGGGEGSTTDLKSATSSRSSALPPTIPIATNPAQPRSQKPSNTGPRRPNISSTNNNNKGSTSSISSTNNRRSHGNLNTAAVAAISGTSLNSSGSLNSVNGDQRVPHTASSTRAPSTVGSVADLGQTRSRNQFHGSRGSLAGSTAASLGSLGGSLASLNRRNVMGSHRNVWFGSTGSVAGHGDNMSVTSPGVNGASSASTFGGRKKFGSTGSLRDPALFGILKFKFCRREEAEVYSTKFSYDEDYVVAGLGDSRIQVYSTRTGELTTCLIPPTPADGQLLPCTSIAFRPDNSTFKNKNVLVAAYADGRIAHWHYTSGQLLSTMTEIDVQVNNVVYNPSGTKFATASSDTTESQLVIRNRVFSVKFHPTDPNVLVSGGWDNTLQIWDVRVGHSVRSIFGPHICGDAVDLDDTGDKIVTGSYSKDNQIQVNLHFELLRKANYLSRFGLTVKANSSNPFPGLSWRVTVVRPTSTARPTVTVRGLGNKYILAGGVSCSNNGINEVKVFSTTGSKRAVGMAQGFSQSVYTSAFSSGEHMVAVGGGFKGLYVFDVDPHQTAEFVF